MAESDNMNPDTEDRPQVVKKVRFLQSTEPVGPSSEWHGEEEDFTSVPLPLVVIGQGLCCQNLRCMYGFLGLMEKLAACIMHMYFQHNRYVYIIQDYNSGMCMTYLLPTDCYWLYRYLTWSTSIEHSTSLLIDTESGMYLNQ